MPNHTKAKQLLLQRINLIIKEFNFNNRKQKNPNECPCYSQNKPCHKIPEEKLNCFFCYCPNYDLTKEEGGCKINNPKGKWFFSDKLPKSKIWDCSDCDIPHEEEFVKQKLKKLFGI